MKEVKNTFSFEETRTEINSSSSLVTKLVDGITSCCGYDFGVDEKIVNFCPICGRKIRKDQ